MLRLPPLAASLAGASLLLFGCAVGLHKSREAAREEAATPPAEPPPRASGPANSAADASAAVPPAAPEEAARVADDGPLGPALSPELRRLRHAAQRRVLGSRCPPGPHALSYAPSADLDAEQPPEAPSSPPAADDACPPPPALGHFVPIEQEGALRHFHRALARLEAKPEQDAKVRILAYGASHTQADLYTGYLRHYLQERFGDGGQGFVLLGRVNRWYRTQDTEVRHHALTVLNARYGKDGPDEPLGLFGAALAGRRADAFGEIMTSKRSQNTRFEVHYHKQPKGGDFSLLVDGTAVARIPTASSTPEPGYHSFEAPPGQRTIRAQLHGNGPVRLFGIVAETAQPGVVIDTLGIGGARMPSILRWEERTWADALRRRAPDLVTFAYGTNECMEVQHSVESYEDQVRAVIARVRKALPDASCLLISPFDVSLRKNQRWVIRPGLLETMEAQRRVAREVGCGFWDGYAFMGGEGSMRRWVSTQPALAKSDRVHLTRLGYVYAGMALGDALMRAYDGDRDRRSGGGR